MDIITYLDFGGSIHFKVPKPGEPSRPLVMVAVAFPVQDRERLLRLLPRGPNGSLLKSSSHGFHAEVATKFVSDLLGTNVCIGGSIANASDPENVTKSREWHANEEKAREEARLAGFSKVGGAPPRKIDERQMNYIRLLFQALTQCLGAVCWQFGRPTSLTVVADREDIGMHSQDLDATFASALRSVGALGSMRWESRYDEPLLHLPDLVAGVIARHFNHDDALPAATLIWRECEKGQRVRFANKVPGAPQ